MPYIAQPWHHLDGTWRAAFNKWAHNGAMWVPILKESILDEDEVGTWNPTFAAVGDIGQLFTGSEFIGLTTAIGWGRAREFEPISWPFTFGSRVPEYPQPVDPDFNLYYFALRFFDLGGQEGVEVTLQIEGSMAFAPQDMIEHLMWVSTAAPLDIITIENADLSYTQTMSGAAFISTWQFIESNPSGSGIPLKYAPNWVVDGEPALTGLLYGAAYI